MNWKQKEKTFQMGVEKNRGIPKLPENLKLDQVNFYEFGFFFAFLSCYENDMILKSNYVRKFLL